MRRVLLLILLLGIFSGCSTEKKITADPQPTGTGTEIEGLQYRAVGDGSRLFNPGDKIYGLGKFIFTEPLPAGKSSTLSLTFGMEAPGSLMLIAHSDNTLENGLHFLFERMGGKLSAKLISPFGVQELSGEVKDRLGDVEGLMSLQWELAEDGSMKLLDQNGAMILARKDLGESPDRFFGVRLNNSELFEISKF